MLEELKTMGYLHSSGAIDKVLGEALPRVVAGEGSAKSKYKDEAKVVQITIDKTLADLLAKIRPVVSAYSFNAAKYQETVPGILDRLKRGIAPIEVLDEARGGIVPASVVGILNAGWELYKTDVAGFYGQFRDEVPEMERLASLNHLLFKAIEASEVKRRWK
jgi:RNA-splicing ligase RtcB